MPQFRVIYTGSGAMRTEQGTKQPYTPFLASAGWLRTKLAMAHKLPTIEEYRDRVLGSTTERLAEMARGRHLNTEASRDVLVRALLDGICPLPDGVTFPEPGAGPRARFEDSEVWDGTPVWEEVGTRTLRDEARARGINPSQPDEALIRALTPPAPVPADAAPPAPPTDEEDADEDDEPARRTAHDIPDDWRAQLATAHAAGDYNATKRLLRVLNITAENGSKKAVLAAAEARLAQADEG